MTRRVPRRAEKPRAKKPKPEPVVTKDVQPVEWLNAVWRGPNDLSISAKQMAGLIFIFADARTGSRVHPGTELLIERTGWCERHVLRVMSEYRAKGFLYRYLAANRHAKQPAHHQLTVPIQTDTTAGESVHSESVHEDQLTHRTDDEPSDRHPDEDDLASGQDDRQPPAPQDDTLAGDSAGDEAAGDGDIPGLGTSRGDPFGRVFGDGEEDAGTRLVRDDWRTTPARLVAKLA